MKHTVLTLLLCLATATADAQFVFRISGGGLEHPSYILGTIHILPGSLLDSIPSYLQAEAECRQLYVESDRSNTEHRQAAEGMVEQVMTLPDSLTIFDVMGEERMPALQDRLQTSCHINLADSVSQAYWHWQPYVFTNIIYLSYAMESLLKYPERARDGGIDVACVTRAKTRGWKVGDLDVVNQEALAAARERTQQSLDAQVDTLMAMLNNYETLRQNLQKDYEALLQSIDYWQRGDYEGYCDFTEPQVEQAPAIFRERNRLWLPIMMDALQTAPTLFVFGAGHLVGTSGIVSLLREAGYDVELMKTAEQTDAELSQQEETCRH